MYRDGATQQRSGKLKARGGGEGSIESGKNLQSGWPSYLVWGYVSWCIVTACMASQRPHVPSRLPAPGIAIPSRHSALYHLRSNLGITLSSAPCAFSQSRDGDIAPNVNISPRRGRVFMVTFVEHEEVKEEKSIC
jgi:hypothetical protein